jgi:hypothetical protein
MAALDTKPHRYLNHITGTNAYGNNTSIARFEIKCPVIFLTNLDFNDPKVLKQHGMAALKSHALISPISHDPLELYEYTGWLCTNGKTLDEIRVECPVGGLIHREGQAPVAVTKQLRRWRLSLAEKTMLAFSAEHAARFPAISPREIYKIARMRLGEPKRSGWRWLRAN